jgi:hypothetical protein
MNKRIIEYQGKKYVLVSDTEGNECARCALNIVCGNGDPVCHQFFTEDEAADHRLVEVIDDVLTEQKMYDDYQERTKTAGDRANDIAWCLVILLAAQLIGGKTYSNFFVACAGGLLYMLLSALQAAWQGAAIWWFKNHHADEVPTDYPEWIGGPAWVLYYLKMAVIAAAVVHIAYSFLMLL